MVFGLKERLNWLFNVGFLRGENDVCVVDSCEFSDFLIN